MLAVERMGKVFLFSSPLNQRQYDDDFTGALLPRLGLHVALTDFYGMKTKNAAPKWVEHKKVNLNTFCLPGW
jgi:hypothetical protein